jgi:hypothetical protein
MAYQTMTATSLRQTVRDITDLDVGDLPDSLLNLYIRDGYYRILDLEKRWAFLEKSFTFNTVAEQREYTIANFTADPISQVVSVIDSTGVGTRLDMVGHDTAEETYMGSYDTRVTLCFILFGKVKFICFLSLIMFVLCLFVLIVSLRIGLLMAMLLMLALICILL